MNDIISEIKSKETALTCRDNTILFYQVDIPSEPKGLVFLVHGVCEHSGRYGYISKKLNENGYIVVRFDLRGHGKSGGTRGFVENYLTFSKDLNELIAHVKKEYKNFPTFVIGHSMGSFISACYAILHPNQLDGQVLSGIPATILPLKDIKLLKILPFNLFPKIYVKNSLGDLVSKDPEVVKNYKLDPLNLSKTSIKMSGEMFIKGPEYLRENIKKYTTDVLLLHGGEDRIVTPKASEWFCENISSKNKKRIVYPGLYHEIFNEPQKDEVIKDLISWLDERLEKNQ